VQKVSKQKSMIKAKEFGKVPIPITLPWKRRERGFRFLPKQNILCIFISKNLNGWICWIDPFQMDMVTHQYRT
jgi:hypothetical protein